MNLSHQIPARASELLISKICHDLVSPIGAVNNGIEFMADMGDEGLGDGIGLIEHSAKQASVRLQLFRMCYGAGGSDAQMTGKIIYETFMNYIADSKVKLDWDLMNALPDQDLPAGFLKTLLNMMVFAFDALPKGGTVHIEMSDDKMRVRPKGPVVKAKDGSAKSFRGETDIEQLSPRTIHGFITRQYADLFGLTLELDGDAENFELILLIP